MENATKALIIAASILLAILIISIGFYIVNKSNAADLTENELSTMEAQIFNQEYLLYEGVQRGTKIKQLLIKAAMYNGQFTGSSFSINGGDFAQLSSNGFGIRGTAKDIITPASKLSADWMMQLTYQGNYKVGVAQPGNIRKIAGWLKPERKYLVSFSYFENGRIREIIIDDVEL